MKADVAAEAARARLDEPARAHAHNTFASLQPDETVERALSSIRSQALDAAIVYFYVVDADQRLLGVVPTRRLLTAEPDAPIRTLMTAATITVSATATVREAAALLAKHRLLAVPVVTAQGRMVGVIDAAALGFDMQRELSGQRVDEIFQVMGFRMANGGSSGFTPRFFSLLWNVVGGLIAAVIAGAHEHLLSAFTALALFMPVTLALSESIGIQSVVLTIERRARGVSGSGWRSVFRSVRREGGVAMLLGLGCAALVSAVALAWQGDRWLTAVVAIAIPTAMVTTAAVGLVIPRILYALQRNPNVAAGPMVLAIADFVSLIVYFRVAALLLP